MRYRVGLAAGLLIALWALVSAACGDEPLAPSGPRGLRPLWSVSAGGLTVSATCGTLGPLARLNDSQYTISYTAPSVGPCKVIPVDSLGADTAVVQVAGAGGTDTGVPFGPFAFWANGTVQWGPGPLTASGGQNSPGGVVTQINEARRLGLHLVLCLAGCAHDPVTTNGAFDLAKWKAAVSLYNTSMIKTAIAAAVADGTVIGNELADEPEHQSWGGVFTKAMLDGMATYARQYFPTLTQGIGQGGTAFYTWRATERYHVLDFVISQFADRNGDVATYRTKVLAAAALDGVTAGFSLNLLNGGTPGTTCAAGVGTSAGLCRMTATQVRDYSRALGPSGCVMLAWKFEDAFFNRADNQQAFRDIAVTLNAAPRPACRRLP